PDHDPQDLCRDGHDERVDQGVPERAVRVQDVAGEDVDVERRQGTAHASGRGLAQQDCPFSTNAVSDHLFRILHIVPSEYIASIASLAADERPVSDLRNAIPTGIGLMGWTWTPKVW